MNPPEVNDAESPPVRPPELTPGLPSPLELPRFIAGLMRGFPARAAAGAGSLMVSSALAQIGTFVSFVIVARLLDQAALGDYAAGMAIASVVVGGPGSGLPMFILRELPARGIDRGLTRSLVLVQLAITAGGGVLGALLGAILIGGWLGFAVAGAAGLSQAVISVLAVGASLHVARGRYVPAALVRGFAGLASAVVTIALVRMGAGIVGASASFAVAGILPAIYLIATDDADPAAPGGTGRVLPPFWTFVGIGSISGGYQRVDSIVLLAVSTPLAVGAYAAAYRFVGLFVLIIMSFGAVWVSWLAGTGDIRSAWLARRRQVTALLAGAVVPLAVVSAVLMPQLVALVYGDALDGAVLPARILMLSVIASALYWPAVGFVTAIGRESVWLKVLCASVLADAAAVAVLGSRWGASGAAIAWLLIEVLTLLAMSWLSRASGGTNPGAQHERTGRSASRG